MRDIIIINSDDDDIEQRGEHHNDYYYEPLPASDSTVAKAEEDAKPGRGSVNKYVLASAVLASTNSILLGYDIGVMSGAVLYIRRHLKTSPTQVQVLVGCLNICSLLGSLASGHISDLIGRRYTLLIASSTFAFAALFMGLAPSFPFLLLGRLVAGIAVGFSLMISPLYVSELSPSLSRGFLSSLPEIFINIGILLGYLSNLAFSPLPQHINWRLMLALASFPAFLISFFVLLMPESPRWLVLKNRPNEAHQVLLKTSLNEAQARLRLAQIKVTPAQYQPPLLSFSRPTRPVLRILLAAIGVNFFMQASGNDAVVYYSPEVFREAGITKDMELVGVTIIMGLAKTVFSFVSALLVDRVGRRPMLLLGSSGMAVSLFGLGLGSKFLEWRDNEEKPGWAIGLCVVAVCCTVSFFSIGLGPITWVYSSEIFPLRLRAQGTGLAISVNRLVSGSVSMTFLTISEKITFGGTFFVMGGTMVVATIFFYCFLPETKGKSLEEIEALFQDDATSSHHVTS